ncbi:MAG: transposase [Caldilineaceae bacterium]|nr:transposase [Caldilineaceae bacterium]
MTGAVEHGGGVFAQLLDGVMERHLTPFLTRNVALSSQLVMDWLAGYSNMDRHFARHHVIEYSDTHMEGEVHTNTIEGFWKQLKRDWYGTHT